jgi:phage baseplate assembly protein gpV
MDEHCENGVVGGAIFSKSKKPSNGNKDKSYVKFDDGTTVTYDRAAHSLDIKIGSGEYQMKQAIYSVKIGTAEFKVENDGYTIKTASENLKAIISDLLDGLVALTVTASPGGGPTSPPINLATFTAIKLRLANLLK